MMKKRKTILAILLSTVLTVPSMGGMYVSATALDEQMVAVEQETLEEGAEGAEEALADEYEGEMEEHSDYLEQRAEELMQQWAEEANEPEIEDEEYEPDEGEVFLGGETYLAEVPYVITETDSEIIVDMSDTFVKKDLQAVLKLGGGEKPLTVNVPAGTYVIEGALYIYSNTTLYSETGTTYQYVQPGENQSKVMLSSYGWHGDVGGYEQIQNVVIDGGTFDANGGDAELVRFMHGSNITVQNIQFEGLNNGYYLTLEGVNGALVDNCTFGSYKCLESGKNTTKEALHIDVAHNKTIAPGKDNYDDAVSRNITISGCYFKGVPRGIGSHSAVKGVFPSDITIIDNTFEDLYRDAIKTFNYKNLTISGNRISNCGDGIFVHTLLYKGEGNFYDPLPGTVTEEFPTVEEGYNVTISNNVIENATHSYGIAVTGHANYPLSGVNVEGNQIGLENEDGSITPGAAGWGIYLNTSARNGNVLDNTIIETADEGIYLRRGSQDNWVERNEIHYTGGYGIFVEDSDNALVHANRVVESGRSSFVLTGSENCDIQENRSKNSGGGGIVAVKGSHTPVIRLNTIYNPSGNAIYVTDSDTVRIVGNTLQRIRNATGIYVQDCEALNTSYNSFTNTTKTPIKLLRVTKANTTSLELIKVNEITAGSTRVRGTAGKAGSTVTVTVNEKDYKTVVAESRTFSSYLIPAMSKGTKVVVTEKDVKGNMVKAAATVA